jgi:hypothetical protein
METRTGGRKLHPAGSTRDDGARVRHHTGIAYMAIHHQAARPCLLLGRAVSEPPYW